MDYIPAEINILDKIFHRQWTFSLIDDKICVYISQHVHNMAILSLRRGKWHRKSKPNRNQGLRRTPKTLTLCLLARRQWTMRWMISLRTHHNKDQRGWRGQQRAWTKTLNLHLRLRPPQFKTGVIISCNLSVPSAKFELCMTAEDRYYANVQ